MTTPDRRRSPATASAPSPSDVSGLAPATTYHYRFIATNSKGLANGADRTFKTKAQPLGVTLAATPNPLAPGGSTTLAGQLTGTGNGGRQIVLQSNPFPYTQGFKPVGNKLITDAAGNFSFNALPVAFNTQFRVALPDKPRSPARSSSSASRSGSRRTSAPTRSRAATS